MALRITVTLFGFGCTVLGVVHTAVASTTTAMESTVVANGCADGSWRAENQSCYLHVQDRKSFYKANESCDTRGANLVSISSDEENQLVLQYVGNNLPVWIGLFRTTNEACAGAECLNWMWLDGSQVEYSNWTMSFATMGQCVVMTNQGLWGHSHFCSSEHGYVCEQKRVIPTITSEPTTIMSASEMTTLSDHADNVASTTDSSQKNNEKIKVPLIVGCVVGGLVVTGIVIVVVVVLVKRHRKSQELSSQRDHERKSQQKDKPRKVKDKKSSTKDHQKNHNNDDSLLNGTTGINLGYCHEDVELGATNKVSNMTDTNLATSAHGGGFNPEPVYAEPIKKKHRPRSEGAHVQENSLYATGQ